MTYGTFSAVHFVRGPMSMSKHRVESRGLSAANHRRDFIGGSDARIIMGTDQAALLQLWREKRGEAEPEDLSGNLVVQLGRATEELNQRWYEAQSGQEVVDVQKHVYGIRACTGWARRSTAAFDQAKRSSRANSCSLGLSRKRRLWRNMRHSYSITCGSWPRGLRCSRSLLAVVNGSRSKLGPIRFTNT